VVELVDTRDLKSLSR